MALDFSSISSKSPFACFCVVAEITYSNIHCSGTGLFSRLTIASFHMQSTCTILNLCLGLWNQHDLVSPGDLLSVLRVKKRKQAETDSED